MTHMSQYGSCFSSHTYSEATGASNSKRVPTLAIELRSLYCSWPAWELWLSRQAPRLHFHDLERSDNLARPQLVDLAVSQALVK